MDAVGTQHGRRRLRQLHRLHNKRKGHNSHGRGEKLNDEGHWAKKRSQAKGIYDSDRYGEEERSEENGEEGSFKKRTSG